MPSRYSCGATSTLSLRSGQLSAVLMSWPSIVRVSSWCSQCSTFVCVQVEQHTFRCSRSSVTFACLTNRKELKEIQAIGWLLLFGYWWILMILMILVTLYTNSIQLYQLSALQFLKSLKRNRSLSLSGFRQFYFIGAMSGNARLLEEKL